MTAELIIFDLGRVLLDFDFRKVIRDLQRHCSKSEQEIRHFFANTPLWDSFERGTILPAEFYRALEKELGLTGLSFETFTPLWNDIFQVMPASVEILSKLKGRYKLAMISNVNLMHWEFVKSNHTFMEWFDIPIASYAVGHRKPEAAIYQLALRRAGVKPEHAVFIDDVAEHIVAARALGIRAHQFLDAQTLRSDLAGILE